MKLNRTDYVLERASDGGYYAWLTVNMQCNAYGESPEEAVQNLQNIMNEMIDEMYMVEEFILIENRELKIEKYNARWHNFYFSIFNSQLSTYSMLSSSMI